MDLKVALPAAGTVRALNHNQNFIHGGWRTRTTDLPETSVVAYRGFAPSPGGLLLYYNEAL